MRLQQLILEEGSALNLLYRLKSFIEVSILSCVDTIAVFFFPSGCEIFIENVIKDEFEARFMKCEIYVSLFMVIKSLWNGCLCTQYTAPFDPLSKWKTKLTKTGSSSNNRTKMRNSGPAERLWRYHIP